MTTITLTEVRRKIMSGEPIDIVYGTHDIRRKTGGDRAELFGVISASYTSSYFKDKKTHRFTEDLEKSKNPNHNLNLTFNVRLGNGDIRTIHWILVEKVNNKIVVI